MFQGETYKETRDKNRLKKQLMDVFKLMSDAKPRTLRDIELLTGHPQSSISARLRDFRKASFGSHTVKREYVSKGLYRYQLVVKNAD